MLNDVQQRVLDALPKQISERQSDNCTHSHGMRGATAIELAAHVGYSDRTVRAALKSLVGRGRVMYQRVVEPTTGRTGKGSSFKRYWRKQ
jgi:predicted ArsR family transcriptional regulator